MLVGTLIFVSALPFSVWSFNPLKYTQNLNTQNTDEASRATLLGIIESCGNATHIVDNCVVAGLNRVAQEENNTTAKVIAAEYEEALQEGNASLPECQIEEHMQANRIIGHCVLLMNYYALQDQDVNSATTHYELCFQGGMQGLAYHGNIVAQFMLSELFEQKGIQGIAQGWRNALKQRKNTPEYTRLMKCYH